MSAALQPGCAMQGQSVLATLLCSSCYASQAPAHLQRCRRPEMPQSRPAETPTHTGKDSAKAVRARTGGLTRTTFCCAQTLTSAPPRRSLGQKDNQHVRAPRGSCCAAQRSRVRTILCCPEPLTLSQWLALPHLFVLSCTASQQSNAHTCKHGPNDLPCSSSLAFLGCKPGI